MSNVNILNLPVAVALDGSEYVPLVQGLSGSAVTRRATTSLIAQLGFASVLPGAIEVTIDGGGGTINAQVWAYLVAPFAATITSATLLADTTGTISVDVWKCSFADYNAPTTPSVANSITGASVPTITASNKYQDTNLSDWETSLSTGDVLAFHVPSASVLITKVTLSLGLNRVVS